MNTPFFLPTGNHKTNAQAADRQDAGAVWRGEKWHGYTYGTGTLFGKKVLAESLGVKRPRSGMKKWKKGLACWPGIVIFPALC